MSDHRSVVVTGAGSMSAHGLGLPTLATALAAGAPRATPIDRQAGLARRPDSARTAARVTTTDWDVWLPRRAARRMSHPSIYGVVAARMALADAGVELAADPDPSRAVVLATAFGACSYSQRMLDQIFEQGPETISPFLFMESVANAPAGQVAISCRASGPNLSLCLREAGPVAALGRGAAEVAGGRAELALVGATEEMPPLLHSVLNRFGALSDRPRPLDRHRDGFLAGEGALVMALEEESAARRRGATPRARVRAWGSAFDPTAPRADWGRDPAPMVHSLRLGLEGRELRPADISAVVCGASGSRRGDRLEAAVLTELFGHDAVPPVFAPKGVTGEYAGIYLAAGLLVLAGHPLAPPGDGAVADPELGIRPWTGPLPGSVERVLVTGLAAGGSGAWALLEQP